MSATSRARGAIPANPNQGRRSAEVADIFIPLARNENFCGKFGILAKARVKSAPCKR